MTKYKHMTLAHSTRKLANTVLIAGVFLLSACGGGGESASESAVVGTDEKALGASEDVAATPQLVTSEPIDGSDARIAAASARLSSESPTSFVSTSGDVTSTQVIASSEAAAAASQDATTSQTPQAVVYSAPSIATSALTAAAAPVAATSFSGKGWYVDANSGSDLNAGTQAAPWKTLTKAASATLAPGDAILLKCGATWRESMQIVGKTSALPRVAVGVYGTCTKANLPVISGADRIQGVAWTLSSQFGGKPVYAAKWSQPVSQLYWNGTLMNRARHPNYGGIGAEFNLVRESKATNSFVLSASDVTLLRTANLAGAIVHLRTEPWMTESTKVQSYNSADGTVTLSAATRSRVNTGEGYVLEGHPAFLDAPGEWHYDTATGTLYVYTASGSSPDSGVLETVQRSVGLTLRNTTDARIENIQLDRQASRSLELIDAPRTVVTDVTSNASGDTGILVHRLSLASGSKGTRIVRATVKAAASTGISINNSPESEVESSTVSSTGISGQSKSVGVGIFISDSNSSTLRSNTISMSASSGVNLGRASGIAVVSNAVSQACVRFTDCGAIYAWGSPGGTPRNTIQSNKITQMTPNAQGAVGGSPTLVAGIYFDIDSGSTDVIGNMISNVGVGLMMLDASNNRFASNYVWPVESASVRIHSSDPSVDKVRGNVIEGNLLYGANWLKPSATSVASFNNSSVYVQQWIHTRDARLMFTGVNPNIVRNNSTGSVTAKSSLLWELVSAQTAAFLDRNQWAAFSSGEQQLQAFDVNLVLPTFTGSNLILNGTMSSPAAPWSYWAASGSVGGNATFGNCSGGCAVFTAGSASDTLSSGILSMSSTAGDNLYMLRFKAQSLTGKPARPTVQIARNGGDWSSLGLNKWVTVAADTETISENLFIATASLQGKLSFNAPASTSIRIRDVSLQKVASYELLVPNKEAVLLANETNEQKAINCADSGLRTCSAQRLNGQAVTWPITLPANSALPLIAADGKWLRSQ